MVGGCVAALIAAGRAPPPSRCAAKLVYSTSMSAIIANTSSRRGVCIGVNQMLGGTDFGKVLS
jgi:hypothetical protein